MKLVSIIKISLIAVLLFSYSDYAYAQLKKTAKIEKEIDEIEQKINDWKARVK